MLEDDRLSDGALHGHHDPWLVALSIAVVFAIAIVLNRLLNRPWLADLLIDTESELRKVTWPTPGDTWKGTLAVVVTVTFMLVYLTGADIVIQFVMSRVMGGG